MCAYSEYNQIMFLLYDFVWALGFLQQLTTKEIIFLAVFLFLLIFAVLWRVMLGLWRFLDQFKKAEVAVRIDLKSVLWASVHHFMAGSDGDYWLIVRRRRSWWFFSTPLIKLWRLHKQFRVTDSWWWPISISWKYLPVTVSLRSMSGIYHILATVSLRSDTEYTITLPEMQRYGGYEEILVIKRVPYPIVW